MLRRPGRLAELPQRPYGRSVMVDEPVSNQSLIRLQQEARLSGEELAKRVNAIGAETGLRLRYGRASVSQWRSGTRPRWPVPDLVAEVLSRSLARTVTAADAGFASDGSADPGPGAGDTVTQVERLGSSVENGSDHRYVFNLHDLNVPAWRPATEPPPAHRQTPHSRPVREDELETSEEMLEIFSRIEAIHGASRVAPFLASTFTAPFPPGCALRSAQTHDAGCFVPLQGSATCAASPISTWKSTGFRNGSTGLRFCSLLKVPTRGATP